jgi:hypothetical protein
MASQSVTGGYGTGTVLQSASVQVSRDSRVPLDKSSLLIVDA